MDGAHDMGGVDGYGPVLADPDESVFHAEWERRTFALLMAVSRIGRWNLDKSRYVRENLPSEIYLRMSYFQIWLTGLEKLLSDAQLVSREELQTGHSLRPREEVTILKRGEVASALARGGPTNRPPGRSALFEVGDRVRMVSVGAAAHTRLPGYVRGHAGRIELVHGAHVFPDSNAVGRGEDPQWLYTVRFDGRELWGLECDRTVSISVDAWEPYMERP